MMEAIRGRGEIRRKNGEALCRVRYQLQPQPAEDERRFTLTDGIVEIEPQPDSDALVELQTGEELTLFVEEPLSDGRQSLTVVLEPYGGHRPDERYQVTVKEGSEWEG
jgi:hypothetical protein